MALVEENAPVTSQMEEYASRTHQNGVPTLASEYGPATIDAAAVPIRVEKWIVSRRIKYRIIGIVWGGIGIPISLKIQIGGHASVDVEKRYESDGRPWALWAHSWEPRKPDTYAIRLRIEDPGVRTRRLDSGFYTRTVQISEI
jgi:hypothetical protein